MKQITSIVLGVLLAVSMYAGTPTEIRVERIQLITQIPGCIVYGLFDDPTDRVFEFPIKLAEGESDVELGRTYTLSEMNTVYTYWMKSDYMTHALYTEATFRKTEITEDLIKIEATATDTNGDSWVLTYDESQEESGVSHTYSAAKPAKRIENGHVIIEKDGIRFNVLGAEMK
jgi:hypothetical protein